MDYLFYLNSFMFGVALAMDSFSVSIANGLNEPDMKKNKQRAIAFTFGWFQAMMPLIGWFCVHTIETMFTQFQKFIPWIALLLLLYIGGKMLIEGIRAQSVELEKVPVGFWGLMLQGVATAIDALSVGFTIAEYTLIPALVEASIIGVVTFAISMVGVRFGKTLGYRLTNKASILGGCILIFIGLEIFIKGVFM
ncbi:MAG: manganese efflux pump [Erysipelotrichaceae bacterium]|nr:manganese efflux pump [Erysipelotrichaceae bacterium]